MRNRPSPDPIARILREVPTDLDAWMERQGDRGLATERALSDPRASKGDSK
jgi:hypothetical protein